MTKIIRARGDQQPDISKFEAWRRMVMDYSLVTALITYRKPDSTWRVQEFTYQVYDLFPKLPELSRFLDYWNRELTDGPILRVEVSGEKLITGADFRHLSSDLVLN